MSDRVLVARIGAERVAFAVGAIAEIVDAPRLVPLPLMPTGVLGQIGFRDAFLPVLDPAALLGVVGARAAQGVALVLADAPAALWVDDADDVWELGGVVAHPVPGGTDRAGVLRALLHRDGEVVAEVDRGALGAAAVATLRRGDPR